jgi:hypothetical protein
LKKLGQSPRLGGFTTRALTMSYVMVEFILDVVALIILGCVRQECPIIIGRGRAAGKGAAVENPRDFIRNLTTVEC